MKGLSILLIVTALALAAAGVYKTLTPPADLFVVSGEFAGCPERPSCVSSMAQADIQRVAALAYTGDVSTAQSMLREVVERLGGHVQDEKPGYLHAVFESRGLRLRDDLELLLQPEGRIEVRSASRFAYSDLGANRDRVERLRRAFEVVPGNSG